MINLPTSKPGNGFALSKEASGVNDPYRTYESSVIDNDEIWSALKPR
jgi:hypothetical protein